MVTGIGSKTGRYILLLAWSLFVGCTSARTTAETPHPVDAPDYAISIRVNAGDEAIMLLPQNSASTGYLWVLDPLPAGSPVQQVRHVRYQNEGVAQPGQSSAEEWRFKATRPGIQKINARYERPWEGPSTPPALTATVDIVIQQKQP